MKRQREDTHLSQAIAAVRSAAVYDTNVKFLLADKQILRFRGGDFTKCADRHAGSTTVRDESGREKGYTGKRVLRRQRGQRASRRFVRKL